MLNFNDTFLNLFSRSSYPSHFESCVVFRRAQTAYYFTQYLPHSLFQIILLFTTSNVSPVFDIIKYQPYKILDSNNDNGNKDNL